VWDRAAAVAQRWCDAFPDDDRAAEARERALNRLPPHRASAETGGDPNPISIASARRPNSQRRFAIALGTVAMVVVAVAALLFTRAATGTSADERQTLLVSEFRTIGADTSLGEVVSEALRVGLRRSRALTVYPPTAVQQALERMKSSSPRGDLTTARAVAARAGVKAVVDGEVLASGDRYLVSVRLVATISGDELATYSVEARSRAELFPAVQDLANDLRRGVGEPLRSVDAARPVERVTAISPEARSKYVSATRAIDSEGALSKGIALLEEAISLDSTFAMALRRLAIELDGRGDETRIRDLAERAYANRARLADPERYIVEAAYFAYGPTPDEDKVVAAYEAVLQTNPRFGVPLNNLAIIYLRRHQYQRAESTAAFMVDWQPATTQSHGQVLNAQINLGRLDAASRTVARFDSASPGHPDVAQARAALLYAQGLRDSAATLLRGVYESFPDVARRQYVSSQLRDIALASGDLAAARRWSRLSAEARLKRGLADAHLVGALDDAWITLWHEHDTTAALRATSAALSRYPLASIAPLNRPYGALIRIFSWAGQPARARAALAGFDSATGGHPRVALRAQTPLYRGEIALAERRYQDALAEFHAADSTSCATCLLPLMGIAYDRAGLPDSAAALFTRFVKTPEYERYETDGTFLALARARAARRGK
jgi:tetratricopeptide (TPR) repeat protein